MDRVIRYLVGGGGYPVKLVEVHASWPRHHGYQMYIFLLLLKVSYIHTPIYEHGLMKSFLKKEIKTTEGQAHYPLCFALYATSPKGFLGYWINKKIIAVTLIIMR